MYTNKMDSSSDDAIAEATIILALMTKKPKKKRLWTRRWLARRQNLSAHSRLLRELGMEDPNTKRVWTRLNTEQYQHLLQLVTPLIEKEDTNMREAVTADERLCVTLRYLATGETRASLACQTTSKETYSAQELPDRGNERNGRDNQRQCREQPQGGLERLRAIARGHTNAAKEIRDTFKEYFNQEGKVPFQEQMALMH
ncbi:hypothetical protein Pcinc_006220 [Petrolisthes cinctipes]|uniref:Uncharacterized protein n=1 Tax=Petrolisthes cinctipes TaxID=88211 RepID=A0AAE1GD94_PETCI|nr:hypothetical protein Pcinc_006220 [Petrolisthes cinctipes]